jgi:predicted DCC family thiol-disulfide oxidoreductase YuxK
VVIYDGHCGICTAQIERLARWDGGGRLAFVSLHDPVVAQRWPELSREQLMADMYVVDRRGRKHRGAAAIRHLSGRLPRLWWLWLPLHLPFSLPLWQWLYRLVANRRYKLSQALCDDGACRLHAKGK